MSNHLILFYISLAGYISATVVQFIFGPKTKSGLRRDLLVPVWLIHSVFLILRWLASGYPPISGLFNSINFLSWCILTLLIITSQQVAPGRPALLVAALLMLGAAVAPKQLHPMPMALKTIWFELHVASAFMAYAFFALAASTSFGAGNCKLGFRLVGWGTLLFSASMVAGGIWAYLAWADYWVWTPKELWSLLIWVYYATVLHAAKLPGWRQRASRMVVWGFLLVIFTYLGVGLLMKSSHPL